MMNTNYDAADDQWGNRLSRAAECLAVDHFYNTAIFQFIFKGLLSLRQDATIPVHGFSIAGYHYRSMDVDKKQRQ